MPGYAMILAGAALGLTACSDIQNDTYKLETTTDNDLQTVELWRPAPDQQSKMVFAFALRFPRHYYAYADNLRHLKQTTIGLMLDRVTLRPLNKIIEQERGVTAPLSVPPRKRGALAGIREADYRDRVMLVTMTGHGPALRPEPGSAFHGMFKPAGERKGFNLFVRRSPGGQPQNPPEVEGFSQSGPVVWVLCSNGQANCTFVTGYKGSAVSFVLSRSELHRGIPVARKLVKLIEKHDVSGGRDK